jgi:quercetin dioxygenase-like cupin family protein
MRRFITGVKDGRSCMVKVIDCNPGGSEVYLQEFTDFPVHPPAARPPARSEFLDLAIPVGHVKWMTTYFPPNGEWPTMHYTDSIDCHTVIAGSVDLILDDGAHTLKAGDCVMVTGVDHAWKAGADGCTTSILLIGTPPPES